MHAYMHQSNARGHPPLIAADSIAAPAMGNNGDRHTAPIAALLRLANHQTTKPPNMPQLIHAAQGVAHLVDCASTSQASRPTVLQLFNLHLIDRVPLVDQLVKTWFILYSL
jgi:hypothetical protein